MRPSERVAWEALPAGFLLMRLDTGEMLQLVGAAAAAWEEVLGGIAGDSGLTDGIVAPLRGWGAIQDGA